MTPGGRTEYAIALAMLGALVAIGVPSLERGELVRGTLCLGGAAGVAAWTLRTWWREHASGLAARFRRLVEPRTVVPRYGQEAAPDPIDWRATEDLLVRLALGTLVAHFAAHVDDGCVALCLDCTAERGEVLVCVLPAEAPEAGHVHPWDVGTWPHHGINLRAPAWRREWPKVQARMEQTVMSLLNAGRGAELPALREQFLCMAGRALQRIATAPELAAHVAGDLRVNVMDHDESAESGLARLDRLRAEAGPR